MSNPFEREKGTTMARRSAAPIVRDDAVRSWEGSDGDLTVISVELTDPERTVGFVRPGAWVAIFVSEDPEPHLVGGSTRKLPPLTRILLPKVQVLDVDDPGVAMAQAARTILTIAVTPAEAEKVICGSRNGDLTCAIRSDRNEAALRSEISAGLEIAPALYGSAS